MKKDTKELQHIEDLEDKILHVLKNRRDSTARRFPLVFGLAVSFGLVSTFYGFEGLINKIDVLRDNPWMVLVVGVSILLATGTAYKKLN